MSTIVFHQYERYDQPYYPDDEIKWSDLSNYNDMERVSNCGSCSKVFAFWDMPIRKSIHTDATKRSYRPWEAKLLQNKRKNAFSKEETKFEGEPVTNSIEIQPAHTVLESGNYPSEFEKDLRLMAWWEYNGFSKNEPAFSPTMLPWQKQIKKRLDILSTKIANRKRMNALNKANEANLKRLLELDLHATYKVEIYRNLGMFAEAKKKFNEAYDTEGEDHEYQFFWVFTGELWSRIKKSDKKIFGLRPVFKIV